MDFTRGCFGRHTTGISAAFSGGRWQGNRSLKPSRDQALTTSDGGKNAVTRTDFVRRR